MKRAPGFAFWFILGTALSGPLYFNPLFRAGGIEYAVLGLAALLLVGIAVLLVAVWRER